MAWIDYRKAYNFVPHARILDCLGILGIAEISEHFGEKHKNMVTSVNCEWIGFLQA